MKIPPAGHVASHFTPVATTLLQPGGGAGLFTFRDVVLRLRAKIAAEPTRGASFGLAIDCDGNLVLLRVGARMGIKRVWNFGTR